MKKILLISMVLLASACSVSEERLVHEETPEAVAAPETTVAIIEADDGLVALLEQAAGVGLVRTKSEDVDSALDDLGVTHFERIFPDAGEYEERTRHDGLHRFYRIKFDRKTAKTKAGEALMATKGVLDVDFPHKVSRRSAIPDDPYFKWQWDLYNDKSLNLACTKENTRYGIHKYSNLGADMNLLDVWETYGSGNSDVIVAVVDGGVDLNHPDLAANCIPAGPSGSKNFTSANSAYTIVSDAHGTHVAGTIAAVRNNGIGVAGIAGGDHANGVPGVRILSCQIFAEDSADDADDADCAAAIKWGADHGAVISQNSWGYGPDDSNDNGIIDSSEYNKFVQNFPSIPNYLKAAIDYFIARAGCEASYPYNQKSDSPMKGGLVVFAAGNDAIDHDPVGKYGPVIAVGAGTAGYTPAFYSNYGNWVDICAPGGDALYNYDGVGDCDTQAFYDGSGSFRYSRGQIFNLYATRVIEDYDYTSYGYMSGTSMACPHISGALALIASVFGGAGFTNDDCESILMDGADETHTSSTQYVGPWVDLGASFNLADVSEAIPPQKVSVFSMEATRKTIELSWQVPADEDDGKAAGIVALMGTDRNAVSGSSATAVGRGVRKFSFSTGDAPAGATLSQIIDGLQFSTTYYFALYAFDKKHNYSEVSEIKSVRTEDNLAPVLKEKPEGILLYGSGATHRLSLAKMFRDPEGDEITIGCSSQENGEVIRIVFDGDIARITALKGGTAKLTVIASDGDKNISTTIPILIKNDKEDPAEVYPNPVTTNLIIRTETPSETYVRIVNSTGKIVYEQTSVFSGFEPLTVDMSSLAPGRYTVTIRYNGDSHTKTIVKV